TGDLERKRFGWAVYPSVLCAAFTGSAYTLLGKFNEGLHVLQRGVALAHSTRHPLSRALILHELGTLHFLHGDMQDALRTFEEAIEIASEGEVLTMYAPLIGWRGATLAELGRADEAIAAIEEVMAAGTGRVAGHYAHYFLLNGLANAYSHAGRHGDAVERAEEAIKRTLEAKEYAHLGHAYLRLANAHAQRGKPFMDDAEKAYRKALERAEAHGMRP